MHPLSYRDGILCMESVPLTEIAASHGTPCYVYSRQAIEQQWLNFDRAFAAHEHLICYAVKANSSLAILNILARLGSGFDIVSGGELARVLAAGGDAGKVVFSGVGKQPHEIQAALEAGIKCFNVESVAELHRINQIAGQLDLVAPVSVRVNPDVDAKTHPYIATGLKENKFGINFHEAHQTYQEAQAMDNIEILGIDCHIGSQITELPPFRDALQRLLVLVDELDESGISLQHIDMGGGLGIHYQDESIPSASEYANLILELIRERDIEIILEPGRSIVGNAGILLTRVEYLKPTTAHNFAIVDAAMNDLMRPSLYDAWHDIMPVTEKSEAAISTYDIVGPVCETGDFLGKGRDLAIREGDLLAVCSAGAYGFTMSSNYNTRPRACEIMVEQDRFHLVRQRESIADLYQLESTLP